MATTIEKVRLEVNENLQTNFTQAQIRSSLQWVLDDLSKKDLLVGSDDSQSLVQGSTTLDFPAGFRAIVAITLTNTESGVNERPLIKLKGGQEAYRRMLYNDSSVGIPSHYSRFDKKFYILSISDTAYTVLIEYYKDHAVLVVDVDTIEFDDSFTDAINSGVTYRMAMKKGRTRMINIWGADYIEERIKKDNEFYRQPRIVRAGT